MNTSSTFSALTVELSAEDLVVCSGDTPASIAGVIGGSSTAVTDSTRTVLLEAATWDGPTIRATSKRLGLRTDASTLFEKGLSDRLPPVALDRAAALIAELSGRSRPRRRRSTSGPVRSPSWARSR